MVKRNCEKELEGCYQLTIKKNQITIDEMNHRTGVISSGTAKCHPEDDFDFAFGANLAMIRLLENKEDKKKFCVGDYAIIKDNTYCFPYFTEWVKTYIHNHDQKWLYNFAHFPKNNRIVKILFVQESGSEFYVQDIKNKYCYIMSEEGLEKVKS